MELIILGSSITLLAAYGIYRNTQHFRNRQVAKAAQKAAKIEALNQAKAAEHAAYIARKEEHTRYLQTWVDNLMLHKRSDGVLRMPSSEVQSQGFALLARESLVMYCDASVARDVPTEKSWKSGNVGTTIRVAKGANIRLGGSKGRFEQQYDYQRADGIAIVTTKRIAFHSKDLSFSEPLNKVATVTADGTSISVGFEGRRTPFTLSTDNSAAASIMATLIGNPDAVLNVTLNVT